MGARGHSGLFCTIVFTNGFIMQSYCYTIKLVCINNNLQILSTCQQWLVQWTSEHWLSILSLYLFIQISNDMLCSPSVMLLTEYFNFMHKVRNKIYKFELKIQLIFSISTFSQNSPLLMRRSNCRWFFEDGDYFSDSSTYGQSTIFLSGWVLSMILTFTVQTVQKLG